MDIIQVLEEFCILKDWNFIHARRDYQNLTDISSFIFSETENFATGETFLFLDPVIRKPRKDGVSFSGNFLVLTNSDIDKGYSEKFADYIEPLLAIISGDLLKTLNCTFDVENLTSIEAINMFDFNADGLSVSFSLKGY